MEVTVVVATFGDLEWPQLAQRAIASVEAQTLRPAEIVAYHGDSLDQARNKGAAIANSKWLCFLDADDELHPGYIEAMSNAQGDLRAPAVQYVRNGKASPPKFWPRVDMADGNWLIIGTLVPRDLFFEVGGFRDWPMYEDWDLWQRCWLTGATITEVPDAVYVAHARPNSRNRQPTRQQRLNAHHAIRRANMPHLYDKEPLSS